MAIKVRFLKETVHDDAMWGVGSVVNMEDEGRAKYFIGMLQAERSDLPESKKPVVPVMRPSNQAEEIGRVIANALSKGMTSREFERDSETAPEVRGRKVG